MIRTLWDDVMDLGRGVSVDPYDAPDVDCPVCLASAGEPCVDEAGRLPETHAERVDSHPR